MIPSIRQVHSVHVCELHAFERDVDCRAVRLPLLPFMPEARVKEAFSSTTYAANDLFFRGPEDKLIYWALFLCCTFWGFTGIALNYVYCHSTQGSTALHLNGWETE